MYSTTMTKERVQEAIEHWRRDTISDSPWFDIKSVRTTWVEDYHDVEKFLEWCSDYYDINKLDLDVFDFVPIGTEAMNLTMYDVLFLTGVRVVGDRRGSSWVDPGSVAGFVTQESQSCWEGEAEEKLDMWLSVGMLERVYVEQMVVGERIRKTPEYSLTKKGREYLGNIKEGKM